MFHFLSTRTVSFRKVGIPSEVPTSDKKAERCGVDGLRVADLSRPYHKGVPDGKLFSTEYTVRWLCSLHYFGFDREEEEICFVFFLCASAVNSCGYGFTRQCGFDLNFFRNKIARKEHSC